MSDNLENLYTFSAHKPLIQIGEGDVNSRIMIIPSIPFIFLFKNKLKLNNI
jgi:hypothetical protein